MHDLATLIRGRRKGTSISLTTYLLYLEGQEVSYYMLNEQSSPLIAFYSVASC